MDNPQHYQPLSYALHSPVPATSQSSYSTNYQRSNTTQPSTSQPTTSQREEEEEEEDDDDEGMVEEHLNHNNDHGSNQSSPKLKNSGTRVVQTSTSTSSIPQIQQGTEPEQKRRPGRPRGSRNKKPRAPPGSVTKLDTTTHYQTHPPLHPTGTGTAPPQLPEVNAQNQQYYEFQWRVLNLCAEFYGAAEELVKGTPPLVVAQCYQMGPGNKVDPLVMLNEAKRNCDALLANPSRLITNPPPPMYPVIPTFYQPHVQTATPASTSAVTTNGTTPTTPSTVITNPQSFVVSLGTQGGYPHTQYSTLYGTQFAPYYQYSSYAPPGTTYYASPPAQATQPQSATPQNVQTTATTSTSISNASANAAPSTSTANSTSNTNTSSILGGVASAGNQGAWSDEEVERLKKLAEDSRNVGSSGEIEWDWVVHQWGNGRTRHQILIKATSLGLKESTGRGLKRRRETDATDGGSSVPPTPRPSNLSTINNTHTPAGPSSSDTLPPASASPSLSHSTSTPAQSPAMQSQPQPTHPQHHHSQHVPPRVPSSLSTTPAPPKSAPPPTSTTTNMPWPMPTVAASTAPVITTAPADNQQRVSYYRQRPAHEPPKSHTSHSHTHTPAHHPTSGSIHHPAPTTHPFMYQPNGNSRLKENGK